MQSLSRIVGSVFLSDFYHPHSKDGEDNIFSLCVSSHRNRRGSTPSANGGGGPHPRSGLGGGYPIPGLDGGYPPSQVWMGGGYPFPDPDRGYPIPGLEGRYPILLTGGGTPIPGLNREYPILLVRGTPSKIRMGYPPSNTGWGYPCPLLRLDGVPPLSTTRWGTHAPR